MKSLVIICLTSFLLIQLIVIDPKLVIINNTRLGETFGLAGLQPADTRSEFSIPADFSSRTTTDTYDSILFVGDVLLGRNVEFLSTRFGDSYSFDGISLDVLTNRPAIFGNFESAMALNHHPTPPYGMRFSTKLTLVKALSGAGFTHVSLANNHSRDYGIEGVGNAVSLLSEHDIIPGGCAAVDLCSDATYIEINGVRVAVIMFDAVATRFSKATASDILETATANSQIQIVFIHWGTEYELEADTQQHSLAKFFADEGVDLVVGHHPHVVQEVALVESMPVVYSLGNYIFDQYFSPDVQKGLILKLQLYPEPRLVLEPVESITSLSQPRLLKGDKKAEFLYALSKRSQENLQPFVAQGEIPLRHWLATPVKTAMIEK